MRKHMISLTAGLWCLSLFLFVVGKDEASAGVFMVSFVPYFIGMAWDLIEELRKCR